MRMMKKGTAALGLLLAMALIFCLPLTAAGAAAQAGGVRAQPPQSPTLGWEAEAAATWLSEALAAPQVGDEVALFALLRSGQVDAGHSLVKSYVETLSAHLSAGGAELQDYETSAWQLLVLQAAGVDAAGQAPGLVEALGSMEQLAGAGAASMRMALLVFGPAGIAPPAGFDGVYLAQALAAARNSDSGYGEDGVSEPLSTARALQALAHYKADAAVGEGITNTLGWLGEHLSDYGGMEMDGAPSPAATAETIIALACLGQAAPTEGAADPTAALLLFQHENGSFSANPDKPADTHLTALGLLALTAGLRAQQGLPALYSLDAVATDTPGLIGGTTSGGTAIKLPGLPALSPLVLLLIVACVVLLIILLAVLFARRGRRNRLARAAQSGEDAKKAPADKPGGKGKKGSKRDRPDDEQAFVPSESDTVDGNAYTPLDIDFEYIDAEAELAGEKEEIPEPKPAPSPKKTPPPRKPARPKPPPKPQPEPEAPPEPAPKPNPEPTPEPTPEPEAKPEPAARRQHTVQFAKPTGLKKPAKKQTATLPAQKPAPPPENDPVPAKESTQEYAPPAKKAKSKPPKQEAAKPAEGTAPKPRGATPKPRPAEEKPAEPEAATLPEAESEAPAEKKPDARKRRRRPKW